MEEKPNGLAALVAYGAPDVYLHGNPEVSIFKPKYRRTTHSSFTFVESKFTNLDDYMLAEIPHDQDLIGKCYLDIILTDDNLVENIYNIIDEVSCIVENKKLETLTGASLEIAANNSQKLTKAEFDEYDSCHVIIPLPFFFTQKPSTYIPNFKESNMKITCKLIFNKIKNIKLMYQTIYLDTIERRDLINNSLEYLVTLTNVITTNITILQDQQSYKFDIGKSFTSYIKDLRILVRSGEINAIKLRLNGHLHMSLSGFMARKIIPRQFYGIENEKNIYYMTFCHDPSARSIEQTSQINFDRIDKVELELIMNPGTYNISIMTQNYNILRINNHHIGFAY